MHHSHQGYWSRRKEDRWTYTCSDLLVLIGMQYVRASGAAKDAILLLLAENIPEVWRQRLQQAA
jgi:hypothetical protein